MGPTFWSDPESLENGAWRVDAAVTDDADAGSACVLVSCFRHRSLKIRMAGSL